MIITEGTMSRLDFSKVKIMMKNGQLALYN
jgi:hypothetical protein